MEIIMNVNVNPSDRATLVGVIDPDANVAGAVSTGWISMITFASIQAIILSGIMGTAGTLDAKLEQATDAAGTGAKDVTGKAITQLVKATNDDDQAIINCRATDLDVNNDFTHVRLTLTTAVATGDSAAVVLGHDARDQPATDISSVVEVV
jgi:hypothetical protein